MIHLILLTGFLGAGKTTLMTSILDAYKDVKVGVIINEFGKINIDAKLLQKDGIEMAELSNGSIFCACIKDRFVDSLIELSNRDLEYLFIEASGLADPSNIRQILEGIQHKTKNKYHYKGAVCVADGENFLDLLDLLPAIQRQIEYSNAVIINKVDLVTAEQLEGTVKIIKRINPEADLYETSYCRVDIRDIIDRFRLIYRQTRETTNTLESRPHTFVVTGKEILNYDNLQKFLEEISKHAYRIKGFAKTEQGEKEISAVGENINLNPWKEKLTDSEIVIISAVGIKMISLITDAIDKHLKGKIYL